MEPIILASQSPRRQEILKMLGIPFQVYVPEFDEIPENGIKLEKMAEYFATKKVDYVARTFPKDAEIPWILGADTVVILDGKIYGKPKDMEEAAKYLNDLQGKTHKVMTSIALYNGKLHFLASRTVTTEVTFAPMTDEEITWYVEQSEWHGAAGGYRIQGLGSMFIEKINGTNSNVVGLPINELYDMLKEQGYSILN